jgi:molybdate transport system substrate-binding protein
MPPVRLFSTLAVKAALEVSVLPTFGAPVDSTFDPTSMLAERIRAGEPFDVIIATEDFLANLANGGAVATPVPLVATGIGLAVLTGAPWPDISSLPALRTALCEARSVAYSRAGASGIYFASLIEKLGIADAVNARATILPKGFTGEAVVDGRADLAVQQTSELTAVDGVELVGELPPEAQCLTRFSAALASSPTHPERAAALVRHLASPGALAAYPRYGLMAAVRP